MHSWSCAVVHDELCRVNHFSGSKVAVSVGWGSCRDGPRDPAHMHYANFWLQDWNSTTVSAPLRHVVVYIVEAQLSGPTILHNITKQASRTSRLAASRKYLMEYLTTLLLCIGTDPAKAVRRQIRRVRHVAEAPSLVQPLPRAAEACWMPA